MEQNDYLTLSEDSKTVIRCRKDYAGAIVIPKGVTKIGKIGDTTRFLPTVFLENDNAFCGCNSLTSIKIPESVTEIKYCAFARCFSLKEIIVDEGNTNYCSKDGVLYSKDMSRLIAFPGGKVSIKIPDSVTEIGCGAFYGCTNLISIEIPNSVTKIGQGAFRGCTCLTSIKISHSVTEIGSSAFESCTSLTSIVFPDGVTEIGSRAFSRCTNLTSIEIPDSVTEIGSRAFSRCTSLTSIEIPHSVTVIGDWAFAGCTSLTSIEIPN